MSAEPTRTAVVLAGDLMFRSRVVAEGRAAGVAVIAASNLEQLRAKAAGARLVMIDMDRPDAVEAIRMAGSALPDARIVAFYSHVRGDLREAALNAGATDALPRSRFVTELPAMLANDSN